ncbi:MAG: Mating pair strabiliation protein, partial [Parcubacteria group bacterium GW2011_GWA2_42_14]
VLGVGEGHLLHRETRWVGSRYFAKSESLFQSFLNRTGSLFSPGYWAAGTNAAISGATAVVEGQWGTVVDAATGAFKKTLQGTIEQTAISKLQTWLMQQAYNAMVEMGATTAANAVFATGSNGAVTGLSANAAAVLNFIGWVYMVYVIVDLLINIIWECEQKEFELGAKKETRQCTFVGSYCASDSALGCVEKRESYCCYGSVVGRIIQESAHEQLGLSYGEIEKPTCEGLTPDMLSKMDWEKVDLSEWIGMLNMAGHLPTANTVSIEDLTGSGSGLGEFSEGEARKNTLDRNLERLDGFDVDAVKKKAEENLR